ncbi:sensor histidine kinase [Thalassotalea nanhaiensis]|uniref:Sensor histidine kinase n=1 Tax=Thalassotalea nanhaiensis TaxID=3065648 RepID=A0ABY9TEF3_9GAMM|nr:sensor histidine kinase [Colwelliaceae bacterium SQ345]
MNRINSKERLLIASNIIPMVCALLIVSHIEFLSSNMSSLTDYVLVTFTYLLMGFPFVLSHLFAQQSRGLKGILIWGLGFVVYPLFLVLMNIIEPDFIMGFSLSLDDYLVFLLFSIFAKLPFFWSVDRIFKKRLKLAQLSFVHAFMLFALTAWVFLMVLGTSTENGLKVASDTLIVSLDLELIDYKKLLVSTLQLVLIASITWLIYFTNNRVLVNYILTNYGVFTYCCAALIFIIIATPAAFIVIFSLPVSQQALLFLPDNVTGIFQRENYIFTFWLITLTTPVILAFNHHHRERRLAQLAQQNTKAELTLLQQQINPHFLFNVLNNIYAKVITKSDVAPVLIDHLASLLRHSVYQGQQSFVPLADEISYLTHFIELQRIRAKDNLRLSVDISQENWRELKIAPLLLIIPIENAFKHSVEKTLEHCDINIQCTLKGSKLSLVCENSLPSSPQSSSPKNCSGVGLNNFIKRLELIYPEKHCLNYGPIGNKWTLNLTIELA